ncbi:sugar ABC transporter ATP-binding protein [Atopococcus tabaci]|uniref:sugar ABC transporter ATP-binding protein n=1 Tax=Atopococcus tabaci TaxID=269774 RepID=UPI000404468B|nr:sugar ABC transporter ATP-binding protein [Atopococcus tabaci]
MQGSNTYLLKMNAIVKEFPGVTALSNVNLYVKPGEVHALLGENGAGKSTLMKCLIGIHQPTSGTIYFNGEKLSNYGTSEALNKGLSMIHQELNPVLHRSVAENIWLGREPKNKFGFIDHKKMYQMTEDVLQKIDMPIDPKTELKELTVAGMQMIEIAKALSYDAKLIIMDEPTSSLTEKETQKLFEIIEKLKKENRSIIYISHKMEEVYTVCDTVTILRDGQSVGTASVKDTTSDELIQKMVGREVGNLYPDRQTKPKEEVKLSVHGLTDDKLFRKVSFDLRKGEVLGFAGLIGAGRTEVMEAVFGLRPFNEGKVMMDGKEIKVKSPVDAIQHKMAFLTEDRRQTGIFPMLSVGYNIASGDMDQYRNGFGLLDNKKIKEQAQEYVDSLRIKTSSVETEIQYLSGGNQQKALLAKWLLTDPDILILDEPTRGIDVGAKSEIHKMIAQLAAEGKSIILISSELPEILGMSDRVVVMHEGKVHGILENDQLTQEEIMEYATGAKDDFPEEVYADVNMKEEVV